MIRNWFKLCGVFVAAVAIQMATSGQVHAGFVVVTSNAGLGANDSLDWSTVGAANTAIPHPFSIDSTGGLLNNSVSQAGSSSFLRVDQGNVWGGGFPSNTPLLSTNGNNGPVTIDFASAATVRSAGTLIQSGFFSSSFTARITVFGSDGSQATFDLAATATNDLNSPIFIGVIADDSTSSIDKIELSVPFVSGGGSDPVPEYFAIGQVNFQTITPLNTVPAPAGAVLFGLGLTGLGGFRLFRRKSRAVAA